MTKSSRDLVEQASRGDTPAIEELLAHHLPGLRRYVAARAGPGQRESRSDLVQSVCRELLEHLREERFEYRGEAEFKQWLYRAAWLKLASRRRHWRAQKRDAGRAAAGTSSSGPLARAPARTGTPSEAAIAREDGERLRAAIAELPETYREVVRLAQIDGLAHAEIALRLGISAANSRMLLSRALARLSSRLARRSGGAVATGATGGADGTRGADSTRGVDGTGGADHIVGADPRT